MQYCEMTKEQLLAEKKTLDKEYNDIKAKNLNLDMSRGKPGEEQLNLTVHMLDIVNSSHSCKSMSGQDCRNYGLLDGLPSCKRMFSGMLRVPDDKIFVGGNSSLNMMFDTIHTFMTKPVIEGMKPWLEVKDRKWLCPVPGYDRHFAITEYFDFQMIPIPMDENGPDMDMVEKLIAEDDTIKGIWCVPKYSNPAGVTYSDEVVRRFANLKPKAKDFRIMWDDAYCIHDICEKTEHLLNIWDECVKNHTEDLVIMFCSTSKITFPGSGVAALATSDNNMAFLKRKYSVQTIGYDKINMLRHVLFFGDYDSMRKHMDKHREILRPKFDCVLSKLNNNLKDYGVASWNNPKGGYFVCVDVLDGTAKRVVSLCKEVGVVLTDAGATWPYGNDPQDSNIRIAPSFPPVDELSDAMDVFCVCTKLAAIEKYLLSK